MLCESLLQFADQTITVPVTILGVPFDLSSVTSAQYKLYDEPGGNELISLDLNSGITRLDSEFTITFTDDATKDLRGDYYHEMTMEDPINLRSNVFKGFIEFEATYNS